MNTDVRNVEDINIHQITECSSLSSVASIEDCFCLFAPDQSPCARMIWILTTNLILLRRLQWRNVEALLVEGKQQVSPFHRDFLLLPEWRSCVHERNVFETRALLLEGKQQVSPFYLPSIHQISTLEKTTFYQHSILSSLMSKRLQQVLLFCDAAQFASSEEIDFHVWVFPGLYDAVEGSIWGILSLLRAIKFIIGFDFAVTLSSPDSFCVLFDITSEHSAELKWLMLNKHKRWFHSSVWNFPWSVCLRVGFLLSVYLIWILESKLIRSNNQNMSHCVTSSFYNHLDHCFVVFKHIQQSFLMRHLDVWGITVNIIQKIDHSSRLVAHVMLVTANNRFHRSIMVLSCVSKD